MELSPRTRFNEFAGQIAAGKAFDIYDRLAQRLLASGVE
jgi:hypothetical protein